MLHVAISLLLYALAAIYVGKLSRKEVERGKVTLLRANWTQWVINHFRQTSRHGEGIGFL